MSKGVAVNTTQNTGNCESRKDEWKGGGGRRKRRLKQREKGTVFHSPSNVLSVKTSRLCFTALHSTASQPLRLMAGLTNHDPSTVLWQGQMGSKRILALNETIRNVAACSWHCFAIEKVHHFITETPWNYYMFGSVVWVNVKGVTVIFVDLPIQQYFSPVEAHKCWGRQPWMESVSYFALSSFWQIPKFVTMINIHPTSFSWDCGFRTPRASN